MQDINLHGSNTLVDPSKITLKSPSACAESASIVSAVSAPTASIETAQSNDEQSTVQNSSVPLLNALWRSPDQVHQIGTLDRSISMFKNIPVNDISVAVKRALALSAAGTETYFACAEYMISNSRVAANVSGAWAFWVDIDCGENKAAAGKGYLAEADAHVAAKQFCKDAGLPQPTHVVSSGSGLHMYWVLSNVLKREVWQAKAVKLKALTKELGFLADDTRTADIASVLRIPGTLNFKYYPPRLVTLLHASDTFIEQAVMLDAIDNAHAKLCSVAKPKVKIPTAAGKPAPRLKWQSPPSGSMKSDSQEGVKIKAMLDHIDPDSSGYEAWLKILMAIHHETAGSEEGFDLADGWSSKGGAYKGSSEIRVKWNSFKSERENSFNIGTIINMVKEKGIDWRAVCAEAEDPFDVCETTVIHPGQKSAAVPAKVEITSKAAPAERNVTSNPLDKFSLKGRSDEIEKSVVDSVPVLGELALMGQATVFFAAHNTGKTLITNSLLIEAIKDDRVDPSKVYYLNMDDSGNGLLGKNRIADEYGFNVLAEGHRDFNAGAFLSIVRDMIENDQARGVVIILDTLKKFVDLMDKGKTSTFTNVIRPFVLKGGTLIALAHEGVRNFV